MVTNELEWIWKVLCFNLDTDLACIWKDEGKPQKLRTRRSVLGPRFEPGFPE